MRQLRESTQYATKEIKHPQYVHSLNLIMIVDDVHTQIYWDTTSRMANVYALTEMKLRIIATKNYLDFGPW